MYIKSSVSLTLAAICGLLVPTQTHAISESSQSPTQPAANRRIQVSVQEQPWYLPQGNSPAYLADASESDETASDDAEEASEDMMSPEEMEYDEGSVDELETEALVEKLNDTGVEFDETEVDSLEYDILMETPDNPPETDSD
ncbi:hypothetical protein [Geitlerinema sp. PCC 9228]|jgi:hypothetical protein|uniref:hypothetical protein n=1 Tax=Geitlerinema sp. PCC 9228 TaxID=111611 RepID=UPI0008F9DAC0|nr:hypothetical protein [Geitlerinema sp. PCC 9228]